MNSSPTLLNALPGLGSPGQWWRGGLKGHQRALWQVDLHAHRTGPPVPVAIGMGRWMVSVKIDDENMDDWNIPYG